MNAYRLNEYEWYAADSFEQAVALAVADSGTSFAEVVDEGYCTGEPEDDQMLIWDENQDSKITVRQIIDGMSGPGYAFGTEW